MVYSQMKEASLTPHPPIARTKETIDSCGIGCCIHCTLPLNHKIHVPAPQFPVGSSVCHRAFTNCFGKKHDAVTGLTVIVSQLIEPDSIPSYYRIKAVGPNGRGYVEAAERFFDAEYKVVMQSHDGDVLNNFITASTEPDVLKRTEQLQAQFPGFTALWI